MYVYGRQPVLEALRSEHPVHQVILAHEAKGKVIAQIERLSTNAGVPLIRKNKNDLQKFVGPVVHQGVIAEVEFQPYLNQAQFEHILQTSPQPFLLILDHIQDTHNLGAILRTAEIAGVNVIVVPQKGRAPLNATVAKTSAGALFYSHFFLAEHLEATLQSLTEQGIAVFATLPGASTLLYQANFKNGTAIVIGSEDRGVRKNLLKYCTQTIKIPQFGRVNSLNASVSAAIVLYEVVRQRNFSD